MNITVLDIIHSPYAIDRSEGQKLYDLLKDHDVQELNISFLGLRQVSTAFLNVSIGKLAQEHGDKIKNVSFIFPEDRPLFKEKVDDVIENALLGAKYDMLLDHAECK